MNQVELWFSILVRRLLKRGGFRSTDELRERIPRFIAYFNRALAKPFRWTYAGRPLAAGVPARHFCQAPLALLRQVLAG